MQFGVCYSCSCVNQLCAQTGQGVCRLLEDLDRSPHALSSEFREQRRIVQLRQTMAAYGIM